MCQSNAYMLTNGNEELIMEDVSTIIPGEGEVVLEGLLGERKTVKARIKELQLMDHKILLEELN